MPVPPFGEPGVCPTIALISYTTNQFLIGGTFPTELFRLRTCRSQSAADIVLIMSATPCLVWFRLDLRLADNPALLAAVKRGGPIVPVFIHAPDEEAPWEPGG